MGVEKKGTRRNLNDRLCISFSKELQISHDSLQSSDVYRKKEFGYIHRLTTRRPSFSRTRVRVSRWCTSIYISIRYSNFFLESPFYSLSYVFPFRNHSTISISSSGKHAPNLSYSCLFYSTKGGKNNNIKLMWALRRNGYSYHLRALSRFYFCGFYRNQEGSFLSFSFWP